MQVMHVYTESNRVVPRKATGN